MTRPTNSPDTVYVAPENPYPTPLPPKDPTLLEMYEAHVKHSHDDYHAYPAIQYGTVCTTPTVCDQAVRCARVHDDEETSDATLVTVLGSVER